MLEAMNIGHDGSMSMIHADNSREALIGMVGINLSSRAVRAHISSAVHTIRQVNCMRRPHPAVQTAL